MEGQSDASGGISALGDRTPGRSIRPVARDIAGLETQIPAELLLAGTRQP